MSIDIKSIPPEDLDRIMTEGENRRLWYQNHPLPCKVAGADFGPHNCPHRSDKPCILMFPADEKAGTRLEILAEISRQGEKKTICLYSPPYPVGRY